jgi:hypothetical protein
MKTLIIFLALTFSVMFSSSSYAEWTKVVGSKSGDIIATIYVDFERIRKHDGYVYWWQLFDLLKPTQEGMLSGKTYNQVDCKLFRYKTLSFSYHKEPMGGGTGDSNSPKNPEWDYPPPNSSIEETLKQVCNR